MKAAGLVLAIALALAVQTAIGRLLGGRVTVDLVLVVVVYAALEFGPVTGLVIGTVAGLAQDAIASVSGIIGVGGLAKTVVGFLAGVLGTQFIVTHPLPRFVVFFGASVVHALLFIGVYQLIGARNFGAPVAQVAIEGVGNALIGLLAFKVADSLPGAVERRRQAGTGLRR